MLQVGFSAFLLLLLATFLSAANDSASLGLQGSFGIPQVADASRTPSPSPTATLTTRPSRTPEPTSTPTATTSATPTATVPFVETRVTAIPTATRPAPPTVTPTPVPTEEAGPPEPPKPAVVIFKVKTNEERFWISEQGTMPANLRVIPQLNGLPDSVTDNLKLTWTVEIEYEPARFDLAYGPNVRIFHRWPAQTTECCDPFAPDFGDVVRGGTLLLTATVELNNVQHSSRTSVMVLGRNPPGDTVLSYLSSQFPSSHYTLWRIAQAESGVRQFNEDGHPVWSQDQRHGVGIMQITNPSPTDDEVWNWKRNADAGNRVLQSTYNSARGWPSYVAGSREFGSAIDAYNAARDSAGLPKVARVTVPEFSSGNLACNLQQRELDAIRLYNGAGGTDKLGLPLHEYKIAHDADLDLLDLVVDEESSTAVAQWIRVEPGERSRSGAADYVDRVLSRAPPGRCP